MSTATSTQIRKRIQSILRRRFTPRYGAAFEVARNIESVLARLREDLIPESPEEAWKILHSMLSRDEKFLMLVDDSSGAVGDTMSGVAPLWLEAAKACEKPETFWAEKICTLMESDSYGMRSHVLEHATELISHEAIRSIARTYREKASSDVVRKSAGKAYENPVLLHSTAIVETCGLALADPELYEEAQRLRYGREPLFDKVRLEVAEIYLRFRAYDGAMKHLQLSCAQHFESRRLELLDELAEATGDSQGRIESRRQMFAADPSFDNFGRLSEQLPSKEAERLKREALELAPNDSNVYRAARLLLGLGEEARAEALLIARQEDLVSRAYPHNLRLIDELEPKGLHLAMTLCYRGLVLGILERAFNKGYRYAATYLRKLKALADTVVVWPPEVRDHNAFVERLRSEHGKKRSFWAKVEGK